MMNCIRRIVPLIVALTLAQLPVASAAAVRYRALLVGVSEYPGLDADRQLHGPRNDVTRLREVLLQRGFDRTNIVTLADGVPDAELPTRSNIIARLEDLAASAKPDDYIVLLMAGHGSQEPVPAGSPFAASEPDGLFEIFLPRDIGSWTDAGNVKGGAVRNAIVDHEIRAVVDRMTARGAFVWAIFDACHSATLVRSGGAPGVDEVRLRQVTSQSLGVPLEAVTAAEKRARATGSQRPHHATDAAARARPGNSVYFYAAQSTEATPEMRLPYDREDRVIRGLFSHTLVSALDGGAAMTYRQLAQTVLARYAGMNEARATPLFSGTALDAPLLGQAGTAVQQWRLAAGTELAVSAGSLSNVQEGALFALLPTAIATTAQALGYARVSRADAARSVLMPLAHAGKPVPTVDALRGATIARLVESAVRFTLSVGLDLKDCASPCPFASAVESLRARGDAGVPGALMRWVPTGQMADLTLSAMGNRLWLMPPSVAGLGPCRDVPAAKLSACQDELARGVSSIVAESTATSDGLSTAISASLHAVARATNLMRIAGQLGTAAPTGQLKTQVELVSKSGATRIYTGTDVPKVKAGDKIRVTMQNTSKTAVDVTALYIDSQYGVGAMYPPAGVGASNRLEAGARDMIDLDINDDTLGTERLAMIVVDAEKKGELADFSFLAQPSVGTVMVRRSAGSYGDVEDLFRFAVSSGYEVRTRGVTPPTVTSRTGMQVFSWKVEK